ncbi:uncharacterized protein ACMZJ9_016082 [Mantella aurantiaca]
MMENRPPLISSDGSSSRNSLERCPRPLYSRDSSRHQIAGHYQAKNVINVKEEVEELYVTGDEQWKEGKVPAEISTDGSSNRNTPERCTSPLYSRDYTQEHHGIPQDDQCWDYQAAAFSSSAGPSGTARSSRGRNQSRSQPSRKQNLTWSVLENSVLVTHTVPHYPKLCGTQGRYLYPYQKKQIWQQIAVAVNAVSRQHRDWKHCRRKLTDIRRAILRKHREHHNASLQTSGGPSKELVLLEYERELMTVLQDEIFSGLGGEYDMDLPEDAAAGSPHASNGGYDARFSSVDNTVLFYSEHEEEGEEELDHKELWASHGDKTAEAGGTPSHEEKLSLLSEAVKAEMSPAPALLWTGQSSLPRRPQPVSPLVHSPSAVLPEASTIPVAFSPKLERGEPPPSAIGASPSPRPYRKQQQQLELQRQQLLAHRRTHRATEVQVRQQRRHHMAVERALNALVRQQRALTQEMAGIHAVLRQAVSIMGESHLRAEPGERRPHTNASSPAPAPRTQRGRARGARGARRPC